MTMLRLWPVLFALALFTTQATGAGEDGGFAITDEGGIPLWSEFQRLGGVNALGYPVSRRFTWDGFVVQATQKAVLQWRPDINRVVFANLLDEMTEAGLDGWLESQRSIPPPAQFPDENELTFS